MWPFSRRHAISRSGVAAAMIGVGLGLLVFDKPEVTPPSDQPRKAPSGPRVDFEVGVLSLGVRGVF